jgi:hypothetical protein
MPNSQQLITHEMDIAIHSFREWRNTREKKCRIPERLWKIAASLYPRYPISIICDNLGLNWGALKRKIDQLSLSELSAKTDRPVKPPNSRTSPPFIELKLNSHGHEEQVGELEHSPSLFLGHSPLLRCALELTKPDGTVMKIFASNEAPLDLLELFKTFLDKGNGTGQ